MAQTALSPQPPRCACRFTGGGAAFRHTLGTASALLWHCWVSAVEYPSKQWLVNFPAAGSRVRPADSPMDGRGLTL